MNNMSRVSQLAVRLMTSWKWQGRARHAILRSKQMRFIRLNLLAAVLITSCFSCVDQTHAGLLDRWASGRAGGSKLTRGGPRRWFGKHQRYAEGGYPSSAAPYANRGTPYAGNPWENGGSGYVNYGDTCAGPHWWDFMANSVFIKRDANNHIRRDLMSQGIRGFGPPNTILATDDVDFNYEAGFEVGGRFQMSAVHSLEAIYMGALDWDDRVVRVTNSHDFYSAFSDFGNRPFGGFEDSDQASITTLDYDSELDSVEVNYRQNWARARRKTFGSWLCGVRYFRIDESLSHHIDVLPHFDPINGVDRETEFTQYDIDVVNHLVGFQVGSEFTHCFLPGFTFGGEVKSGVYGDRGRQQSQLTSTTLIDDPISESAKDTGFSYVSDASVFALWQFHPLWKLRVGYEVMWFHNVASAASNYNSDSPYLNEPSSGPLLSPLREVDLNDHDNMLFHGFHVGVEFGW